MRRPERISKLEPHHDDSKSKHKSKSGGGVGAGVPLFLKRGEQQSGALEKGADDVAHAAKKAEAESLPQRDAAHTTAKPADLPAADAGAPLDPTVRRRVEPVVGEDLSRIRVHQSTEDRQLVRGMNARAFAHGNDIWLGPRESASDLDLMAHEAAHVVQQRGMSGALPIQKQDKPAATPVTGTPADMVSYLKSAQTETDASLKTELGMLNRYKPTVDLANVEFKVMTAAASYVGGGLTEDGRSHWDGNKPVIELTQEKYETIAKHQAGTADLTEVHSVVRTVGHELFHLYREKTGLQSNPLKPIFDGEAAKRMEQIHQNWVDFAKNPGGAKELGVPKGTTVTKWEDILEAERKKIDTGATDTSQIQGLYERTAYLVEEIYDRIEELSYVRMEQKAEAAAIKQEEEDAAASGQPAPENPKRPSLSTVSYIANMVNRLSMALDQSAGSDFMTKELLEKTRKAMLEFLRNRYPHKADPKVDSYEVIFYLVAKDTGHAPMYNDQGALISAKPPEARVP